MSAYRLSLPTLAGFLGATLAVPTFVYAPPAGPLPWLSPLVALGWLAMLAGLSPRSKIASPLVWGLLLLLLSFSVYSSSAVEDGWQWANLIHILLWMSATVAVLLASAQSLLLLYRHYRIKTLQDGRQSDYAPMDEMNRTLSRLAMVGLGLVSLALIYSYGWSLEASADTGVQKQILALSVWALLATVLASRWLLGFRGHRAAGWLFATMGALVLVLAWVSSFHFG